MQEIIIVHGIPASGKSTYAKEYIAKHPDYVRINRDDLRCMFGDKKVHHVEKFEKFISDMQKRLITGSLVRGNNVLIDDTNVNRKTVENVLDNIQQYCNDYSRDVSIRHVVIECDSYECIARDAKRSDPVGKDIINKFQGDFSKAKRDGWLKSSVYHLHPTNISMQDTSKPMAILCDLDGTFALVNNRNVYDTANCESDGINEAVRIILESLQSLGYELIFVTGRSDAYREQTQRWLDSTGVKYNFLFMRKQGDSRKDAVVKKEIYENYIQNAFYVECVFDDRNQVVDMWRNLGITCMQVASGDF